MRNLDSCRRWWCMLCPCNVRHKFVIHFWNRTILLCMPCTVCVVVCNTNCTQRCTFEPPRWRQVFWHLLWKCSSRYTRTLHRMYLSVTNSTRKVKQQSRLTNPDDCSAMNGQFVVVLLISIGTETEFFLRSSLFCDVTQRWFVVGRRRFGTACRIHPQGPNIPRSPFFLDYLILKDGVIGCSETSVTNYGSTLTSQKSEDLICTAMEA